MARLKIDQVSLKLVNQGIQQFDISKSSKIRALSEKRNKFEDYKKDLELMDEEEDGTHFREATMEAIQC